VIRQMPQRIVGLSELQRYGGGTPSADQSHIGLYDRARVPRGPRFEALPRSPCGSRLPPEGECNDAYGWHGNTLNSIMVVPYTCRAVRGARRGDL
jgi:hypothetical protein